MTSFLCLGMMRMYYYTPVFHRGIKLSVIDGTKLTSLTTPLNNRGLKRRRPYFLCLLGLTTPLNNRGLKPQDIVYFAVLEGGTPQVIPRSCEKRTARQANITKTSGHPAACRTTKKTKPIHPRCAAMEIGLVFCFCIKKSLTTT